MTQTKLKIMVIDDDQELTRSVCTYLEQVSYLTFPLNEPIKAIEAIQQFHPDLVLLDVIMPERDGIELCRAIRQLPKYLPIIMLTNKADIVDKVVGLEIGADDYVTKPFSLRELEARIKSVLRRKVYSTDEAREAALVYGNLLLDENNRILRIGSRKVSLTPREYSLMKTFLSDPGRAFSRDDLLEKVWGKEYRGLYRTIDSHVNRLRAKLGKKPDQPEIISTVWGIGYKLNEDYSTNN